MQEIQKSIKIIKTDRKRHLLCGVVLEPETVDLQGQIYSAEEIEKAAHEFMEKYRNIGEDHERPADAVPVQSYIAPIDISEQDQVFKKGSWVMWVKVNNVDLWDAAEAGDYAAFSIGGYANVTEES
jgi:DNA adenine methylase